VQTFDSNGPNVKIRGNAYQVFERYLGLAREAQASGDRVAAAVTWIALAGETSGTARRRRAWLETRDGEPERA